MGFAVRALHDALGGTWLRAEVIARLAAVLLPLFLAVTLSALNLADLATVAGPMLVILVVNTLVSLAFVVAALVVVTIDIISSMRIQTGMSATPAPGGQW